MADPGFPIEGGGGVDFQNPILPIAEMRQIYAIF